MFRPATAALALFVSTLPALGQDVTPIAGSAMVDQSAAFIDAFGVAMDSDRDSLISSEEIGTASDDFFASMDADADGYLTLAEMRDWEHGFGELAAYRGREAEFTQALNTLFDLMDADRDMRIDRIEHIDGLHLAQRLADRDGDGAMSLTEFREDFIVITALRRGVGSATGR